MPLRRAGAGAQLPYCALAGPKWGRVGWKDLFTGGKSLTMLGTGMGTQTGRVMMEVEHVQRSNVQRVTTEADE
jgi:hypothetical protein